MVFVTFGAYEVTGTLSHALRLSRLRSRQRRLCIQPAYCDSANNGTREDC